MPILSPHENPNSELKGETFEVCKVTSIAVPGRVPNNDVIYLEKN